ncbi:MAG: flagellar biosynthesis anti-sigma factor FlgM [Gammaproteobacteria bacterium]|nr:flagellar biosynthesis anti-sigma factor FlgM [Gammaproteobacteria bacterium]
MSYTIPSLANNPTATLPSNSQTNNECNHGNKITAIQPTAKTDVLTLSQTAKSLNSNEQLLSAKPEIDLKKVASIKHALANGTYPLDAEKVAAKFIEIEDLLGKL